MSILILTLIVVVVGGPGSLKGAVIGSLVTRDGGHVRAGGGAGVRAGHHLRTDGRGPAGAAARAVPGAPDPLIRPLRCPGRDPLHLPAAATLVVAAGAAWYGGDFFLHEVLAETRASLRDLRNEPRPAGRLRGPGLARHRGVLRRRGLRHRVVHGVPGLAGAGRHRRRGRMRRGARRGWPGCSRDPGRRGVLHHDHPPRWARWCTRTSSRPASSAPTTAWPASPAPTSRRWGVDAAEPHVFSALALIAAVAVWVLLLVWCAHRSARCSSRSTATRAGCARSAAPCSATSSPPIVLAGAIGGFAGSLIAQHTGFVSPDLGFWTVSGEVLSMVIVGGMGSLVGAALGAAVLMYLLRHELSDGAVLGGHRAFRGPRELLAVRDGVVLHRRWCCWPATGCTAARLDRAGAGGGSAGGERDPVSALVLVGTVLHRGGAADRRQALQPAFLDRAARAARPAGGSPRERAVTR